MAIRYWLQQEPLSINDIADLTGYQKMKIRDYLIKCIKDGDVVACEHRLNPATGRYIKIYKWVGEETIEGLMGRAASLLRDSVATPEAAALAREIFVFVESRSRGSAK